jgi:hypothetical protein
MADETTIPYNTAQYHSLPEYYTNTAQDFSGFIQDYLAKMNEPGGFSSGYTGDRVAGIDPYQTQAYQNAGAASGYWNPYFSTGADMMNTGADWMTSANAYSSQVPKTSFTMGRGMITDQYGNLSNVDPYFQTGAGALSQAAGYIGPNATYDPNQMATHLSPYVSGVADEIERRANENLFEDVLPQVNSTFTGAGQFGSTRNADFTNRAIRDNQREILGAQSNALNQAWGQAANDYLGWARQGLGAADSMTGVGTAFGGLGSNFLDRYTAGANMGTSVGNIGGQQASYSNILGGLGQTMAGIGDQYGTYGIQGAEQLWNDIGNLYSVGGQMQDYNQKILDTGYKDWLDRWQMPAQLASSLSGMIPNYTGRLQPDVAGYSAPTGEQSNNYEDILALILAMEQI